MLFVVVADMGREYAFALLELARSSQAAKKATRKLHRANERAGEAERAMRKAIAAVVAEETDE